MKHGFGTQRRQSERFFPDDGGIRLSPITHDRDDAVKWLKSLSTGLDGVIAKRLDYDYRSGDRTGMQKIKKLRGGEGFTGKAPGGPSRWSSKRSTEWEPLRSDLVVEVQYDHFSGDRFRHGTKFMRWRPDKAPRQCRMEPVERESRSSMAHLVMR